MSMTSDELMGGTDLAAPAGGSAREDLALSALDRIKYMAVRAFLYAWARCFSLKGLYLFGRFFGLCEWLINHRRRRRFHARLRHMYEPGRLTPSDMRRICLQHFMRVRCDKLFYLIFDKLPKEKILKRVKFHNRQYLDEAASAGNGVFVMLSHYGSHHVAGLLMALMGYEKVAGVRDRKEGSLRLYVQQKYEETFPEIKSIKVFFADSFPRDIYRCFQDGYILGSAVDVDRDRGSRLRTAPVTIFGKEKEFLTGPIQIALRCRSPILQGFVISKKNFYFHLVVTPPLKDPRGAKDDPACVQEILQRYADNIQEHVRAHPDHISKL
jgi:lauroyl/myristoyl acyltransferase